MSGQQDGSLFPKVLSRAMSSVQLTGQGVGDGRNVKHISVLRPPQPSQGVSGDVLWSGVSMNTHEAGVLRVQRWLQMELGKNICMCQAGVRQGTPVLKCWGS